MSLPHKDIPHTSIALSRPAWNAVLESLLALEALDELRLALDDLWQRINDTHSELRCGADDAQCVAFTRQYVRVAFDQIARSFTLERARVYLRRLLRATRETCCSAINDIDLNRWKEYDDILTDSLWVFDRRAAGGAHHAGYWGNFVPQIPYQLMRRYTRRGDLVIDPFAGSGTTLIEARRLGRAAIGVELNPTVAAQTIALLTHAPDEHLMLPGLLDSMDDNARIRARWTIEVGDSTVFDWHAAVERLGFRCAHLAILHPPYHTIIRFSDDPRDLSNATSVDGFLDRLGAVASRVVEVLEPGRYLALVLGDTYANGEWTPLGFLGMQEVARWGFTLKSIVVKNFERTAGKRAQQELWRYRALVGGFYVFKHEYIFILRRK